MSERESHEKGSEPGMPGDASDGRGSRSLTSASGRDPIDAISNALEQMGEPGLDFPAHIQDDAREALAVLERQREVDRIQGLSREDAAKYFKQRNEWADRAVAAEAALAEANRELEWVGALNKANIENGNRLRLERDLMKTQRDAYIQRADDLADALRTISNTEGSTDKAWQRWAHGVARAALDRQEQR